MQTLISGHWLEVRDGDPRLVGLYGRHYSAITGASPARRRRYGVSGVGESICLLTVDCRAGFIWVRNTIERYDKQQGVNCTFFRNEGDVLSSALIREACELAWQRWPGERLYTYVNPKRIRSTNPGTCFLKAGWSKCGMSKGGLVILEKKALE